MKIIIHNRKLKKYIYIEKVKCANKAFYNNIIIETDENTLTKILMVDGEKFNIGKVFDAGDVVKYLKCIRCNHKAVECRH